MKFKVGDKVKSKETGKIDVVKSAPGMAEYDVKPFAMAERGFVLQEYGWSFQEDWEQTGRKKTGKKVIKMKFKVGNILRVNKRGREDCYNFRRHDGVFIKITKIDGFYYYDIWDKSKEKVGSCYNCLKDEHLTKSGRSRKEKPIKFIVFYDETDGDPAKKFINKKELIAWIKEAKEDKNIVFGSIEVYPVSERLEVELKTNVSLKVKK